MAIPLDGIDPRRQQVSGLETEEWLSIVLEPRWYDVIEERMAVLERLTAPVVGAEIINGYPSKE